MNNILKAVVLFFLIAALPTAALAQQKPRYDASLVRLAEILGSLHYISNLCGLETNEWRDRMSTLIDAEKPDKTRLSVFYTAFNDAYRAFAENYRQCTPAAVEAGNRYKEEGQKLTLELMKRYGN